LLDVATKSRCDAEKESEACNPTNFLLSDRTVGGADVWFERRDFSRNFAEREDSDLLRRECEAEGLCGGFSAAVISLVDLEKTSAMVLLCDGRD
jgi:hypothetical protein